jgi:predicted metal-dependent phosphotriesterase family hydrolase
VKVNRRAFLKQAAAAGVGAVFNSGLAVGRSGREATTGSALAKIMTVTGPVSPEALGFTLPHEHVLVDFIGAEQVSPDRYDKEDVIRVVLPYLKQVKDLGCRTMFECTPAYLGRDVTLLERLSSLSGLTLVTNTGYYGAAKEKFVPEHVREESADRLADRWTREWRDGIDGTGIRPGFIKTGVDGAPLSAIDTKLVRAAARTHLRTGLTIASHTGGGKAALEQLAILKQEGVDGLAWVWVHAQSEKDTGVHAQAAARGAWLEFDGIGPESVGQHINFVMDMKLRGLLGKVMVSQDAGWYRVGEPDGGTFRAYDTLFTKFLPALKQAGLKDAEIRQITVTNPAKAFAVNVKSLTG